MGKKLKLIICIVFFPVTILFFVIKGIYKIIEKIKNTAEKEDKDLNKIECKGSKYRVQDIIKQYEDLKKALDNNDPDEVMKIAKKVVDDGGPFGQKQIEELQKVNYYNTNNISKKPITSPISQRNLVSELVCRKNRRDRD